MGRGAGVAQETEAGDPHGLSSPVSCGSRGSRAPGRGSLWRPPFSPQVFADVSGQILSVLAARLHTRAQG